MGVAVVTFMTKTLKTMKLNRLTFYKTIRTGLTTNLILQNYQTDYYILIEDVEKSFRYTNDDPRKRTVYVGRECSKDFSGSIISILLSQ